MLDFSVFSIERIPLPLTSNLLPLLWHVTQLDNVNVSCVEVLLMGETFIVLGETILVLGETICAKLVMGETRYNLLNILFH